MFGVYVFVVEDIIFFVCVMYVYVEIYILKYDVVRCMLCFVMFICSYRFIIGLFIKVLIVLFLIKRKMGMSYIVF